MNINRRISCNIFLFFILSYYITGCDLTVSKRNSPSRENNVPAYQIIGVAEDLLTSDVDSTRVLLESVQRGYPVFHDTVKAFFNNTFGVYFWYKSEFDSAIHWFKKSLAFRPEDAFQDFKAKACNNIGILYSQSGLPDSAAKYLEMALAIDKNRKFESGINKNLYDLGVLYMRKSQYQLALGFFNQLKENLDLRPDKKQKLLLTTALGNLYFYLDSLNTAVAQYEQSLQFSEELHDTIQMKMALSNLSAAYSKMPGQFDKVLYYSRKGLEFATRETHYQTLLVLHLNVGEAYLMKGIADSALVWFKKAGVFIPFNKNQYLISSYYLKYAESLLEAGQLTKAQEFYQKAAGLSLSIGSLDNQRLALLGLSRVDSINSYYQGALDKYQQAIKLEKMIFNKENNTRIAELQIIHETAIKERQIVILREKDKNNQLYRTLGMIIFSSLLIIMLILIFYLRNRRLSAEQKLIINRQENEATVAALEAKRKELTGKAYSLAKAEKLIDNLKSEIQGLIPKTDMETSHQLQMISRLLKQNKNSQKLWLDFEQRFDELNNGFIRKLSLRYPDLSSNELRMCALLRLQLSTKELAEISGRSIRTIEYTRLLIRKKMKLDAGASLTGHLLTLE